MRKRLTRRQALFAGVGLAIPAGCGGERRAIESMDAGEAPTDSGDASDPADASDVSVADTSTTSTDADAAPTTQPGLVVEVAHSGALIGGQVQATAVAQIVSRGMRELTGMSTDAAAWSSLFVSSDVVGIKVSPVGYPEVFSHVATLQAIIAGLNLAGVPNENIVVFDRYADYLDAVGYPALLPNGVRFEGIVPTYTEDQTGVTGYDAAEFADIARVHPGDDPNDPQKRRSCVSRIVSTGVTKVVNVPALKDHISAGVTCALKNMTYGCVNNVSRTHAAADANWTKDFVPVIAALTKLRQKVVLHIADALVACYDGGPGPPPFKTFPYASLLFATDPVALDRIAWSILDAQRSSVGLPALADTGTKLTNPGGEFFEERQPQHVLTAGAAGLGIADLAKIDHRKIAL